MACDTEPADTMALVHAHAKARTKTQRRNKPSAEPWQAYTKQEIEQYKKYNVLYGERKYARVFAEQKQTLSFTDDLPTEVRLRIYGYLFHIPGDYFELWAPWCFSSKGSGCRNKFDTYARKKRALGIMRLSKKVHEEVAQYFYGQHNMRFSTYNGFLAMAVFNHTIRRANCDFIKHITVQIPNREDGGQGAYACMHYIAEWDAFKGIQKGRGMRIPDFGFRMKHYDQGRVRGEYNYDKAVHKAFRQLRNMASLRTFEILIPEKYRFIHNFGRNRSCECSFEDMHMLGPVDRVRHYIEEHSGNPEYWALLANLKQQSASQDLTIALVLMHGQLFEDGADFVSSSKMAHYRRQGRWLAAYASIMGYQFGHTSWEAGRTYTVRYDKDRMLSVSPEEAEEHLLEPPELPV